MFSSYVYNLFWERKIIMKDQMSPKGQELR